MKVALLFSGQARFVNSESYTSIKKFILDKYDCDIYCHLWYDNGIGLKYECSPWNGWNELDINKNVLQEINSLYKPLVLEWDFPLGREKSDFGVNTINTHTPYNVRSMYTSLQLVYKHFKTFITTHPEKKYDFIIRIRYDTIINAFPNLRELTNDKLYVPDRYWSRELYPEEKYPGISNISINECWITNEKDADYLFFYETLVKDHIYNLYLKTNVVSDEQLFSEYIKKLKVVKLKEEDFSVSVPYKSTHSHLIN